MCALHEGFLIKEHPTSGTLLLKTLAAKERGAALGSGILIFPLRPEKRKDAAKREWHIRGLEITRKAAVKTEERLCALNAGLIGRAQISCRAPAPMSFVLPNDAALIQ